MRGLSHRGRPEENMLIGAVLFLIALTILAVLMVTPIGIDFDTETRRFSARLWGRTVCRCKPGRKPDRTRKKKKKGRRRFDWPRLVTEESELGLILVRRVLGLITDFLGRADQKMIEADVSLSNPMHTGMLFGLAAPLQRECFRLRPNFLGQNRARGVLVFRPYQAAASFALTGLRIPWLRLLKAWRSGRRRNPNG
jgi:hypothetical protein